MQNLLHLPPSTFVDKLIPKARFVKASDTPTAVRDLLAEEFEQIRLLYVLRADTLNVEPGSEVAEIDMFYFRCKGTAYSEGNLCKLDLLIPRHTLYIIERPLGNSPFRGQGCFDLLMQHKETVEVRGEKKWRRGKTEWLRDVDLSQTMLRMEGLTMEAIYTALLSQMSGLNIASLADYKEQTAEKDRKEKLLRQIELLERKERKETQPRRKYELHQEIMKLKNEI